MPCDDIITREDLNVHCALLHEPLGIELRDLKDAVKKIDGRMWALITGILLIFITSSLTLVVSLYKPVERAPVQGAATTHRPAVYTQAMTDTSDYVR